MTRKEQKEERRKTILMTALHLFVEKGFYETKISDIAKAVSMSTGLMFHYFESKEELLLELVKMGVAGTETPNKMADIPPEVFFKEFLNQLFKYADEQPWVFDMFVLMGQVRRAGMPEEARQLALSVNQIENSAKIIEAGQKTGIFREGDSIQLSTCFWSAVQGIMEDMARDKTLKAPNPDWIVSILCK